MIKLTPLEETVAVKELIQKGVLKAEKEAFQKGELIGEIRMAQNVLKRPATPRETLLDLSVQELEAIVEKLESVLFV